MKFFFLISFLLQSCILTFAHTKHKGKLFIIGGGEITPHLIQKLYETSQLTQKDYIAILPMSSDSPTIAYQNIYKKLRLKFSQPIINFYVDESFSPTNSFIDSLKNAKLIFITGGDQNVFMQKIKHTNIKNIIKENYHNGATIAGTSAGAALMSQKMITGNQLYNVDSLYTETFDKVIAQNIEIKEGLGLLDSVIIDQHFLIRSRYNRLISAIAQHPKLLCIGIDESTALIIQNNIGEVVGKSQVVVFKNPQKITQNKTNHFSLKNLNISFYLENEKIKVKK